MFPIFMELTLRRQKTLFLSFYVSGTQTSSKNYGKIHASVFWKEEDLGAKEASKRMPEGKKGGGPRGQVLWPRGAHSFGPRGSVVVDLSSTDSVLT